MATTQPEVINADLLSFLKGVASGTAS
jgi:hypothetical protein